MMDMSLPEELIWAAVYAQELSRNGFDKNEVNTARCCMAATRAVLELRAFTKQAFDSPKVKKMLSNEAFYHMRQMVYKADD